MSKRYYVYRLIDEKTNEQVFQGQVEIPEQTDQATMNDDDARSMVADAVISKLMRSNARPLHSLIQYCELQGDNDERLSSQGEDFSFAWERCEPSELELNLGEED